MEGNKWGERKGRVILKNPNVVRYEHDYFGEEIRYVCYCGMRLCSAEYVNDVTWYRHRKRAKANAEKSGKVFTCPERSACWNKLASRVSYEIWDIELPSKLQKWIFEETYHQSMPERFPG